MRDCMTHAAEVDVSRETLERLQALADLVLQWNNTVNLVSPSTIPQLWTRHIVDSLRLAPYLTRFETVADLGSGAGFPGLVISIALDISVVLIEADRRKASFLREAIRLTNSSARIHVGRIEDYTGPKFDTLTARAFLPLERLITISRHLLATNGRYLLLKGADALNEVDHAALTHCFSAKLHASAPLAGGVLEIHPTAGQPP